jgi:hypothetical protein
MMPIHDSRRYHRRRRRPPTARHFNTSSGSSNLMFPMGSQQYSRQWGRLQAQGANPMLMGFGFGPTEGRGSQQYQRFQNQLATAQGPMAEYIRQGQGFLPQMMPGLQRVGADVAGQSQAAFQNLLQGINQGQAYLGQGAQGVQGAMGGVQGLQGQAGGLTPYQQRITQQAFSPGMQQPLQAGQQALGLAGRSAQGAFGPQAQQGLNLAQQAAAGVFNPQAQQGLDLARQAAMQAFNPLQNQTLFQQALGQAQNAARQGAAARGLMAGGAGQAAEEGIARQLATQFAGQQQAGQQAALQGLAQQQANLAGLQQAGAAGVGGQFQNMLAGQQNALAGLGGQAAGLQGLQGGLQNLQQGALQGQQGLLGTQAGLYGQQGEMANALAGLAPGAAQLAGMGLNAMPLYQQGLAAQYSLPFAGMQDMQGFFTGGMQPGYGLLQAAAPQVGQNQSSWGIL